MKRLRAPLMLLTLAAWHGSACSDQSAEPDFTPAQRAALDTLVKNVERATRESFEQNDWSILARLYPAHTFDCWTDDFTDGPYSFLSRPGIPADASYSAGPIGRFMFGNVDASKMHATHFIEIRYQRAYLAKCGNQGARIFPQEHFFVRQLGDHFELTHFCPGDPANLPAGFSHKWPMISVGPAREVVDRMSPQERTDFRQQLLAERIPLKPILDFGNRHQLSDAQTYFAIDRICELTTPAGKP